MYGNWNKIEGVFVKEFNQVWAMVVQKESIILKTTIEMDTDDNSSVSGSSGEYFPLYTNEV